MRTKTALSRDNTMEVSNLLYLTASFLGRSALRMLANSSFQSLHPTLSLSFAIFAIYWSTFFPIRHLRFLRLFFVAELGCELSTPTSHSCWYIWFSINEIDTVCLNLICPIYFMNQMSVFILSDYILTFRIFIDSCSSNENLRRRGSYIFISRCLFKHTVKKKK